MPHVIHIPTPIEPVAAVPDDPPNEASRQNNGIRHRPGPYPQTAERVKINCGCPLFSPKGSACPLASIRHRLVELGRSAEDNRTIELFVKEQFWAQIPDDIIFEQDEVRPRFDIPVSIFRYPNVHSLHSRKWYPSIPGPLISF